MMTREATVAVVEDELPALVATAGRRGWAVSWLSDSLALLADGRFRPADSSIRLHADLAGYRAVPPGWTVIPPDATAPAGYRFPVAGTLPGGSSSIFHPSGVMCAPFNRLAYQHSGGPHGDWGGPASWLDVKGHVRAVTLAEMLAVIAAHLNYSPGWQ
jgi:hypothetical protein